jgi:predicted DNA-binding helix-hairpin-helix protein
MTTRTLAASVLLGLALASFGCAERRYRRGYDSTARGDRYDRVDINSASHRDLQRLPGLSDEDADRIVANRPYPDKESLVRRGVIGPRKYEQIEDYVYAGGRRRSRADRDDDHRRHYGDEYR